MAYIVRHKVDSTGGAASSYTINLPAHDTGDVLVMFLCHDGGFTSGTPTNWTLQCADTYGDDLECWTHIGQSTPDKTVSFTFTTTNIRTWVIAVIKGADTTTPVDSYSVRGNAGAGSDPQNPSVTTTTNNCLVLSSTGNLTGNNIPLPKFPNINISNSGNGGYNMGMSAVYRYQDTTGATGVFDWIQTAYGTSTNVAGLTVAIKDDGNNLRRAYFGSAPAEVLHPFGDTDSAGSFSSTTTQLEDPSNLTGGTNLIPSIGSVPTVGSLTAGISMLATYVDNLYKSTRMQTTNASYLYPNYMLIASFPYASSFDLSDEILHISHTNPDGYGANINDGGAFIGFSDGTNSMMYCFNAEDTVPYAGDGFFPYLIQMRNSSNTPNDYEFDETGTFNVTSNNRVIMAMAHEANYCNAPYGPLYLLRDAEILGGSSSDTINFSDVKKICQTSMLNSMQDQGGQALGQYYCTQILTIGNGGNNAIYWDSTGQSIEYPSAFNTTLKRYQAQIDSATLKLEIDAGTGTDVKMNSNTINMGNYHKFVLTSGNLTSSGLLVLNATITLNAMDNTLSGITFSQCKEITLNDCDLSGGCTIDSCVDATAVTVTSNAQLTNLNNCTFKGNDTAITITGDQTGTWTGVQDITFTNNTTKIEYTGDTDFTIQVNAGTNLVTADVTNSGLGTLTIAAPAKGIVFNNLVAGSQVVVYETGTTTELFRVNSSSTSETYTATATGTVDYTIMKAGYKPKRSVGYVVGDTQSTVDADQEIDRAYEASSGLTYTTNTTANQTTKIFTLNTDSTLQNFYSHMIEEWIDNDTGANQHLRNVKFPIIPNGNNSFTLADWEFNSSTDIAYLSRDGMRYTDTGTVTAVWSAIWAVGETDGMTAEYQQVSGASPTDAANTGDMDELVQVYGDATHGNFDYTGHMIIKYQVAGYDEGVTDVYATYGTLADELYVVAVQPTANDCPATDPGALSITVDYHAPTTWNGKDYSITITDTVGYTGEQIWNYINYNLAQDGSFDTIDVFNWSDMIFPDGTQYRTNRINIIGTGTNKGVRVVQSDGTTPHADFARFMADDGTYYTVPVTANASVTNIVNGSRLQIVKDPTGSATEIYNDIPGTSYSLAYIDGTTYSDGDVLRIRITECNTTTAQMPWTTTVVVSSTGWSTVAAQEEDAIYTANSIDGTSLGSLFSADFGGSNEINVIAASNFTAAQMYAYYCYQMSTANGIRYFFNGISASDSGNYKIKVATLDLKFDNATTKNIYQNDTARIYRDDDTYPVKDPTTSGFGIDINWKNVVYVQNVGGSSLTPAESAALTAIKSKTDSMTFSVANELDVNVQSMNDVELLGSGQEGDQWRG